MCIEINIYIESETRKLGNQEKRMQIDDLR